MYFDPKQAAKFPDIIFVSRIRSQLFDPLVKPFNLGRLFIIGSKIFVQNLCYEVTVVKG